MRPLTILGIAAVGAGAYWLSRRPTPFVDYVTPAPSRGVAPPPLSPRLPGPWQPPDLPPGVYLDTMGVMRTSDGRTWTGGYGMDGIGYDGLGADGPRTRSRKDARPPSVPPRPSTGSMLLDAIRDAIPNADDVVREARRRHASGVHGMGSDVLDSVSSVLLGKTAVKSESNVNVSASNSALGGIAMAGATIVAASYFLGSGMKGRRRGRRRRR